MMLPCSQRLVLYRRYETTLRNARDDLNRSDWRGEAPRRITLKGWAQPVASRVCARRVRRHDQDGTALMSIAQQPSETAHISAQFLDPEVIGQAERRLSTAVTLAAIRPSNSASTLKISLAMTTCSQVVV
jgi:hypothetical protein